MLQEEIARLTGKLVFQVDNRPLMAFEKRLGGVLNMLKELSTLANKKFTVKVALDSRSLRAQIDKATKTKITLSNVDISNEALHTQGKRIQDYLNRTTINLNNVKVDISKLVEQKRFVKTLLGQMTIDIPAKIGIRGLEAELRADLKGVAERNPLKIKVELNNNNLAFKLRRALIEAQRRMGEMKLRVADPQVRLKVDRQHLIDEIKAAIASHQFDIRVGARGGNGGGGGRGGSGGSGGRGLHERGLSTAMGFARGALPGLGAAFALGQMNDINQQVQAATNSLHAVSGSEQAFASNRNFLENMAKEMGLNFRDLAPQFSSIFQAAQPTIGIGGTQDMFRGIMKYGTVHGLDKESMKGSMRALSQMFGKDKIQSEEARQQFAERMPGGMRLLAQAAQNAKLTTNGTVAEFEDLMRKGKADPSKILPELAKLMEGLADANDAYTKSLETTRVAQGRMNRQFEQSVVIFSKGGFDRGMASFFNTMSDSMERAAPLTEALGGAFEILVKPVNALISLAGSLGEIWPQLSAGLGMSEKGLAATGIAAAASLTPLGRFVSVLSGLVLIVEDFVSYMKGEKSVFGDFLAKTPEAQAAVDNIANSFKGIVDILGKVMEKLTPVSDGLSTMTFSDAMTTSLKLVDGILQNILNTMKLIQALTNGDTGAADQAASGINLLGGNVENTTYNRVKRLFGLGNGDGSGTVSPEQDTGPGFFSRLGDWATAPASKRGSIWSDVINGSGMPQPQVSPASGTESPADKTPPKVDVGGININIKMDGVSDPEKFAYELKPHLDNVFKSSMRDMIGTYRANTAER